MNYAVAIHICLYLPDYIALIYIHHFQFLVEAYQHQILTSLSLGLQT